MLQEVISKQRRTLAIQISAAGKLKKQHSTLYHYTLEGGTIEFVANFGTPSVNGYIVQIEGDAPIYMSEGEFNRQYQVK